MKTALLFSLALLASSAGAAFADGLVGGCDEDHDGTWNCSDGDSEMQCVQSNGRESTAKHSASVGLSLALLGSTIYSTTRKRRR